MNGSLASAWQIIQNFLELGGPVVAILLAISVVALALVILKYWQFTRMGVGHHDPAIRALSAWQLGNRGNALKAVEGHRPIVSTLTWQAMVAIGDKSFAKETAQGVIEKRLEAEALNRLQQLRRGFRALDSIAQITPLLGLFGTVLGMIGAFQALQAAGSSVDPSLLAGGIWVALLTTAVGLGVAMPTSLALTHLESRVSREASMLEYALTAILNPVALPVEQPELPGRATEQPQLAG